MPLDIAKLLKYGFTSGFNMNYSVPRLPLDTNKLKCVLLYHVAAYERECLNNRNDIITFRIMYSC
jgi:hypothetical protein